MNDFFYLIPVSILLGAAGLVIFLWTLRDGQYDDLDGAAQRILYEEDEPRPDHRPLPPQSTPGAAAGDDRPRHNI